MTGAAVPVWFARHELTLAWRDVMAMMTSGKRGRERIAILVAVVAALFLHALAYGIVAPYADVSFPPDHDTLVVVTGSAFLSWTLMMSQAMESVTRAFYARADLDLLLSSPTSSRMVFALRIGAITVTTILMSALLVGPFIDVLIVKGGARWICAYGVLAGMSALVVACAVAMTVGLFRLIGPKRTRLVSQIVAAIVGATFVIGVQVVSIFSYGNLSRIAAFRSDWVSSHAPALDSFAWWPARAAMGDGPALAAVLVVGFGVLALVVLTSSRGFARHAVAAAGVGQIEVRNRARRTLFRRGSPAAVLRRKEWTLLARDPWLVSQTLMQILYLIPPALLLWRNFREEAGSLTLIAPVLVMAAGQLAGGLAWLAISGEDAPDLVRTAPIRPGAVMRSKIEAVIGAVALPVAPIVLILAVAAPETALITAVGVLISASSATAIQIFFRAQAKRSYFRRRQTSSRIATLAEALSSINWAATAVMAALGSWFLAAMFGLVSAAILFGAWLASPRGRQEG